MKINKTLDITHKPLDGFCLEVDGDYMADNKTHQENNIREMTEGAKGNIVDRYTELRDAIELKYFDNRPLTDETLRELGFEKTKYSDYELTINGLEIIVNNGIGRLSMERYGINKVEYKTVGSVRMLIEALKGEIK